MLAQLRGFNAVSVAGKTSRNQRGGLAYPDNLFQLRDDPSTELDYDGWCRALKDAGVNWIRINLTGLNRAWPGNRVAYSFEPPPHGTYNLWKSVLDPTRSWYHTEQVTVPVSPIEWDRSNLGQLVAAAQRHEIKFNVVPFDNNEFRSAGWRYHASGLEFSGQVCGRDGDGGVERGRTLELLP